MKSLVIGGSGLVGGYIVKHLLANGERPLCLTRSKRDDQSVDWVTGDFEAPETLKFPDFEILYCTASAIKLPNALPAIFNPALRHVIAFTSTSIVTKLNSQVPKERAWLEALAEAEKKIAASCEEQGVTWTILRPTLIYGDGRDINITPLSRIIRKFGFMPIVGGGRGLRQPVHAEDLAIGAIAAASSSAARNQIYALPGGEILTYKEMIGRIFDHMGRRRIFIPVPAVIWRVMFALAKPLFPTANVAMGLRMTKDMVFDAQPAEQDLNWSPRMFKSPF